MKYLLVLFSLFLFMACAQTSVQDDKTIKCYPNEWSDEALNITNNIDDFEIISLEKNDNNTIGLIGQIGIMGDNLIILDKLSQKIFAFDLQGRFKHIIGNKGKGPGEYVGSAGFTNTPDKSQLVLNVMQERSLMHFSPQGKFISEYKLPKMGHKIAFINDTLIGIHSGRMGYNGGSESYFELWITNKLGVVIDSLFYYKEALRMDFGGDFIPSYEKGTILYTKMSDYSIYKLSAGKVDTLYRFDFGVANLDTSFYLRKENFNQMSALSDKIQGFGTVTNTKSDLLATFTVKGKSKVMILVNHLSGNHEYFPLDSTGMGFFEGIPVPIARWADDTYRYSKIPAFLWEMIIDDLSDEQKEICRKKIPGFQKSEATTENDNPIILRFKFKDF